MRKKKKKNYNRFSLTLLYKWLFIHHFLQCLLHPWLRGRFHHHHNLQIFPPKVSNSYLQGRKRHPEKEKDWPFNTPAAEFTYASSGYSKCREVSPGGVSTFHPKSPSAPKNNSSITHPSRKPMFSKASGSGVLLLCCLTTFENETIRGSQRNLLAIIYLHHTLSFSFSLVHLPLSQP